MTAKVQFPVVEDLQFDHNFYFWHEETFLYFWAFRNCHPVIFQPWGTLKMKAQKWFLIEPSQIIQVSWWVSQDPWNGFVSGRIYYQKSLWIPSEMRLLLLKYIYFLIENLTCTLSSNTAHISLYLMFLCKCYTSIYLWKYQAMIYI